MKIIGVVQARLGINSRGEKDLCLKPIGGRPLLQVVIDQLKKVSLIDKIVLAIPDEEESRILINRANEWGVGHFIGSKDDIIKRLSGVFHQEDADLMIRVMGDRLGIISEKAIQEAIYQNQGVDYIILSNPLLPVPIEIISRQAMKRLEKVIPKDERVGQMVRMTYIEEHPEDFSTKRIEFRDQFSLYADITRNIESFVPFPPNVHIELTNMCNLHCKICYARNMKRSRGFMGLELYKKIIDELSVYSKINLAPFLHGESFLHPNFLEMIKYAKKKGIETIAIDTNGTFLSKLSVEEILNCGIDSISISMHGATKDVYEKIMGGSCYDIVKKNIEDLILKKRQLGLAKPDLSLTFVLDDMNKCEINKIKDEWLEKVDRILIKRQIDTQSRFYGLNGENLIRRTPCQVLWACAIILWNGDITICCSDYNGKIRLGNAKYTTIKDVWVGQKYQRFRWLHTKGKFDNIPLCKNCQAWFAYQPFTQIKNGDKVITSENIVLQVYSKYEET